MASFNKVVLMGNLTRDPQLKHLPSNLVVAEFGLACNRRYRTAAGEDKEEVVFVDCTAFARQAETIGQYCTKGKPLFVEGRLKFDTWEDKQGGGKRSKITVVVENFQFIGAKNDGEFPNDMYAHGGADDRAAGTHRPATRPGRAEQQSREQPERAADGGRGRDEMPFGEEKAFAADDIPF